ncbi:MAG: MMPL family transporter [Truepera sp.]|nr:MMPL family transporter [Truepera sp.]
MMRGIANLVVNRSRSVILVFVVLTGIFGYGLTRLEMDDSLDVLQPDDSPAAELNAEIEETFGARPLNSIAMVEGEIYTPQSLEALRHLTSELEVIDGVVDVLSVANSTRMIDDDGLLLIEDLLPEGALTDDDVTALKSYLQSSYTYRDGLLVSNDGRYATFIIEVDEDADIIAVAAAIKEAFAKSWSGNIFFAGEAAIQTDMQLSIQRDLPLLTLLAAGLILVFLFLNFRTTRGVVLPLLTVLFGAVSAMGTIALVGMGLTSLSVVAPIAILAVGSSFSLHLLGRYHFELSRDSDRSFSLHLLERYYFEQSRGNDRLRAVRLMLEETGLGVLISGLAISAAMLTFLTSETAAVRGLGVTTALGVLGALAASLFLLPSLLCHLPTPKRSDEPERTRVLGGFLRWLAHGIARTRIVVLGIAAVIIIIAVIGAIRIQANTAVVDFFPKNAPTRKSIEVIEDTFGGSTQVQIRVTGDLGDPELLQRMLSFQERARAIDGIGPSTSIATIYRNLHEVLAGEEGMPQTREAAAQELLIYQFSGDVQDISELVTLDNSQGIISVTAKAMSTKRTAAVLKDLQALADEIFAGSATIEYAGQVIDNVSSERAILKDFILSLTLAITLVVIIDSLVRSVRAAIITVLALLITIALQYGILGYLGIDLDVATMLLGALAIGVGDYAIHLTVRYMEERRRGLEPGAAMEEAMVSSGRAIFFTALTLGAGFAPLMLGGIVPIQRLGTLMVVTVVSVGVASLTLLPAACLTFLRNPQGRRPVAAQGAKA